jgi:MarR family transcriptional regulator, organic hydroperoxide resistance regulator
VQLLFVELLKKVTILIENRIKIIGFLLGNIGRTLKVKLTKSFNDSGYEITAEQFSILMYLWKRQGINQQELSDNIFKEKTTTLRLIDHLEGRKLIKRVRDDNDRRNNLIYLTEEGIKLKDALIKIVTINVNEALFGLSQEEIEYMASILQKVYCNIKPDNENLEFLNKCGENFENQKHNSVFASTDK